MKDMIRAFSLMSEEDQREGLERIHKLFDGPVPQTTTEPGKSAVIDISSYLEWRR